MRRSHLAMALTIATPLFAAVQPVTSIAQPAMRGPSADIIVRNSEDVAAAGAKMRAAAIALREVRGEFAPSGTLHFRVRLLDGGEIEGLTLSLHVGEQIIALPIDGEGLVAVADDVSTEGDWTLAASNTTISYALRPVVLSPGTTLADRRMGDYRAQCRTFFALIGPSLSAEQRSGFESVGGCGGALFQFNVVSERQIASATLDGTTPLELSRDGAAVHVPINDAAISNEARVRLTYRD